MTFHCHPPEKFQHFRQFLNLITNLQKWVWNASCAWAFCFHWIKVSSLNGWCVLHSTACYHPGQHESYNVTVFIVFFLFLLSHSHRLKFTSVLRLHHLYLRLFLTLNFNLIFFFFKIDMYCFFTFLFFNMHFYLRKLRPIIALKCFKFFSYVFMFFILIVTLTEIVGKSIFTILVCYWWISCSVFFSLLTLVYFHFYMIKHNILHIINTSVSTFIILFSLLREHYHGFSLLLHCIFT